MKNILLLVLGFVSLNGAWGHPLGIFSVNRYSRIELRPGALRIVYVLDVAEIPAAEEIAGIDANRDGALDDTECRAYARGKIATLLQGVRVETDGIPAALRPGAYDLSFPPGQGGLRTVRLSFALEGSLPADSGAHTIDLRDDNFSDGRGWKEIVAVAGGGSTILRSSVPAEDLTDGLRHYPAERLNTPPACSEAEVQFRTGEGDAAGDAGISSIAGGTVTRAKDAFAELISARDLSFPVMTFSLLFAMLLGAGHALTPGHGKTIVAAYLVGSRGTARHAVFLGLTVTATHTAGVFALGLIAMFASRYVVPGDLYPWLSLASGLIVLAIGLSLLKARLGFAKGISIFHVHGEGGHTHLPPAGNSSPVSWRRLAALGISGGLLPCPSALVVLLSAVALGRIGFGLLLIAAFSAGLAGVLTGIGILMVSAKKLFARLNTNGPLLRWFPVMSAAVVTAAGAIMSFQAFGLTGAGMAFSPSHAFGSAAIPILALGFTLGLKHALDADHLVAVSTIVSGRRGIVGSTLVGGLWGIGHTLSLMAVGLPVIAFHIRIAEKAAQGMEFAVALMLVILGVNVLRTMRAGQAHDTARSSPMTRPAGGKRPLFIGMVHGLAGSAALMLVVLATIPSAALAVTYIAVFGFGSVGGMMLMSTLLGLPFALTARRCESLTPVIRGISGVISVGFGLFLAFQIGILQGLFL